MRELGDWLSHATTLTVLGFVMIYASIAPWWRTPIGRNIMALAVANLLVFALISANLVWGLDWVGRQGVRVATFAAISSIFAWRTIILVREQFHARRAEKEAPRVE